MRVTTHMCRGNFRSSWAAEGGYEFVAEALLNELDVDGFFMEFDDERSGGFEPLRFLPKGKLVVLGLVTTKRGELEQKDELKRRIEEATPLRRHRPAVPLAAVRLLLDGGGQRADAGRAARRSSAGRRDGARGLGLTDGGAAACAYDAAIDQVIRTTCPRDCYDACGVLVAARDGRIRHVRGDPDHPVAAGSCAASARSATTARCSTRQRG